MSASREIWIVDDDKSIRWVLERALAAADMNTRSFASADDALAALVNGDPVVIVTDIRMPGTDGIALLEQVGRMRPELPIIVMTAFADLDRTVAAFKRGAFEYLPKPFDVDDAVALVRRAANATRTIPATPSAVVATPTPEIIGDSPAIQAVFRVIGRLSSSNLTVLLTGESGTGKELVAHALHRHGPRADKPFIALNTAAIPRDLLEAELFGHERGAFTGAANRRVGRFEQAHEGTLFLDEIGDMPADLQTRLLRVLADGEFYRVGGQETVRVDVRVIAATHQDLEQRVRQGTFREDLYHRINVIRLRLPPLRERVEDIPVLVDYFLRRSAVEIGAEPKQLRGDALSLLQRSTWPGNVRQLENVCRRLTIMAPAQEITAEDLPDEVVGEGAPSRTSETDIVWSSALRNWAERHLRSGSATPLLDEALPRFETMMIQVALRAAQGHRQEAARLLGWGRNTLTRKIQALGLEDKV